MTMNMTGIISHSAQVAHLTGAPRVLVFRVPRYRSLPAGWNVYVVTPHGALACVDSCPTVAEAWEAATHAAAILRRQRKAAA